MKFKLKTFVAASILLVMGGLCYVNFQYVSRLMNSSLHEIQMKQLESVTQIISSALTTMKDELESSSGIFRSDNDLASSYILSTEMKDRQKIRRKLNQMSQKVHVDYIDIVPNDGNLLVEHRDDDLIRTIKVLVAPEGYLLYQKGSSVFLFFYSPLELYSAKVGTLVLGRDLHSSFASKLAALTGAEINFSMTNASDARKSDKYISQSRELFSTTASKLYVDVRLKATQFDPVIRETRKHLIFGLGIGLQALLLVIYLLFEFGILRSLNSILGVMQSTSDSIDGGSIPNFPTPQYRIREMDGLAKAFSKMVSNLRTYDIKIKDQSKREVEVQKQLAVAELAQQVAHDIRGPIITLESALRIMDSDSTRPVQANIKDAIHSIRDIASTLVPGEGGEPVERIEELLPLIQQILSEVKFRYRDVQFNFELSSDHKIFAAKMKALDFKRILSNLITNSVDALRNDRREITIRLSNLSRDKAFIEISDNGIGIDENILPKLGVLGASFGKPNGQGRGLYHAKQIVEHWGGSLKIISKKGEGTKVSIELPLVESASSNHVETPLHLTQAQVQKLDLVLIDDRKLNHSTWEMDAHYCGLQILCLDRPEDEVLSRLPMDIPLFVDKNLPDVDSGFEIAKHLFETGHRNIYITTAAEKFDAEEVLSKYPFLRGTIGKEFPTWIKNIKMSNTHPI